MVKIKDYYRDGTRRFCIISFTLLLIAIYAVVTISALKNKKKQK